MKAILHDVSRCRGCMKCVERCSLENGLVPDGSPARFDAAGLSSTRFTTLRLAYLLVLFSASKTFFSPDPIAFSTSRMPSTISFSSFGSTESQWSALFMRLLSTV